MAQNFEAGPGEDSTTGNRKVSGVFPTEQSSEGGWGFVLPYLDGRFEVVAARDGAVVGSGEEADVRIEGADVAARHARIEVRADGVYLEDLDTSSGTFVGGVRARRIGVTHGDVVRFGAQLAIFVERGLAAYRGTIPVDTALIRGPRDAALFLDPALGHAQAGRSFVIEGGPGLGKRALAELAARERESAGPTVVLDGATLTQEQIADARTKRPATWILLAAEQASRPLQSELVQAAARTQGAVVIATLNMPLDRCVADGLIAPAFASLFSGRRVTIPPLSARREDIPQIVWQLARKLGIDPSRLSVDLIELIARAGWPGGVSEIEDVLRETSEGVEGVLGASAVQRPLSRPPSQVPSPPAADDPALARARLVDALAKANGSIASAARTLGMSRQAVYREAQRLGLEVGKRKAR